MDLEAPLLTHLTPQTSLPENAFAGDTPLVAILRGEYVAGLHRGTVAVSDLDGRIVLALGDPDQPAFMRSAAKPFQVMPAVLAGAIARYGIAERELAVLCASHHAEPRHVEAVLSVLDKIGLDPSVLRCGVHPPLSPAAAETLTRKGTSPGPEHNNCSGAHTGMLLACVARGWPIEGYGLPDHPLQVLTRAILAAFAGLQDETIEFAIDNCAVPTFRLPLKSSALAFARLAAPDGLRADLRHAALQVVSAMTDHPGMVGGETSFDTALMSAGKGAIVSKGGAEGFAGIGVRSKGIGVAMKISDGNSRAIPPTAIPILERLGTPLESLADLSRPEVRNHQGELVGSLMPVFQVGDAG